MNMNFHPHVHDQSGVGISICVNAEIHQKRIWNFCKQRNEMKRFRTLKVAMLAVAAVATSLPTHAQVPPSAPAGGTPTVTWTTPSRAEPPPLEQRTYEDNFTFKWHKSFNYDPWVWGYTKEFAERFKMPEKWIEPELKGALAIAFRMTTLGSITCGLSGKANNCWLPLDCQMDVYFDSRTPLPWKKPEIEKDTLLHGFSSNDFLARGAESRQPANIYPNSHDGTYGYTGLDTSLRITTSKGLYALGGASVIAYDQQLHGGVTWISWSGIGVCPRYVGPASVPFFDLETQRKLSTMRMPREKAQVMHRVEIPESYIRRAKVAYERDNKPNQEVIQRLLRNFQENRQPQ